MAVLGTRKPDSTPITLALIGEQDILGDRLVRPHAKPPQEKLPISFPTHRAALSEGDLVVHIDHGIGRFVRA